ncbi:MAG: CRISPR-associated endonuclease Cas1 [Verrucomicrobia bacterium]|nr:CRISPR-associated endonuclease Cas1 [Verrucomicrobiota bacterium]
MPAVFLTTPGTRASLVSERLRIETPPSNGTQEQLVRDIPLVDIEHVIAHETAHVTMAAIAELMRRNIPLVLNSNTDTILGLCLPPAPHSAVRVEQYRKAQEPSFTLALAINWVEAKILNGRRVLQRLAANREELEITPYLLALGHLAQNCQQAGSLDTLRGYEGTAAGRYFECYATFFPEHTPFERRSRRPAHNAPNAILSYAYTLLSAEAEACLHAIGLDPAVGFFHEPADRRPSLALDIIEPFRAPLADAMALDLLTHGVLNGRAHFENRNGGVYLNVEGRKRFFVAYERRMEREFTSEHHGSRTSLRRELHNQCRAVKKAVSEGEPFEPFLMN